MFAGANVESLCFKKHASWIVLPKRLLMHFAAIINAKTLGCFIQMGAGTINVHLERVAKKS
jgi:kynureninase